MCLCVFTKASLFVLGCFLYFVYFVFVLCTTCTLSNSFALHYILQVGGCFVLFCRHDIVLLFDGVQIMCATLRYRASLLQPRQMPR